MPIPMKDWQLADLCRETYIPPTTKMVGSDLAFNIAEDDDAVIVAFRGTTNAPGWARDFDAVPKSNHLIGWCHAGFLDGATALMQYIDLPQGKRAIFTGHSLGAALAAIVFGLRHASGESADELVTFGSPRPAFAQLSLRVAGFPVREYLRGNDPVPDLPYSFAAFPYRHVREPMIGIGQPQTDAWLCHSITGYISDLKARDI